MTLKQLKNTTMAGILLLSLMRILPIYIGAFLSLYAGLVLLVPAYLAHRCVCSYFGYHLWKFKEISDIDEFVPLPKDLVPKSNSKIDISWCDDLTPEAQSWLKQKVGDGDVVTNYEYANAGIIDTMYFQPKLQRIKTDAAHKAFLATKE